MHSLHSKQCTGVGEHFGLGIMEERRKSIRVNVTMTCRLKLGDVESAESSARMVANLIADKKRRTMKQQRGG